MGLLIVGEIKMILTKYEKEYAKTSYDNLYEQFMSLKHGLQKEYLKNLKLRKSILLLSIVIVIRFLITLIMVI